VYRPTKPFFEDIGLGLVEWEGTFEGIHARWLRWCTEGGVLVPTGAERAAKAEAEATKAQVEAAKAQVEAANAQAEATKAQVEAAKAQARAERLAEKLRAMGIDPNGEGS
jgi:uncharacterized protein YciI